MDYIEFTKEHFETFAPKQKADEFYSLSYQWIAAGDEYPFFSNHTKYRRLRSLCTAAQIEAFEGKAASSTEASGVLKAFKALIVGMPSPLASNTAEASKAEDCFDQFHDWLKSFKGPATDDNFPFITYKAGRDSRDEKIRELEKELKDAQRYGSYKDETATTFMNQVKKLQVTNQQLEADAAAMREALQRLYDMALVFCRETNSTESRIMKVCEDAMSSAAGTEFLTTLQKYKTALDQIAQNIGSDNAAKIAKDALGGEGEK